MAGRADEQEGRIAGRETEQGEHQRHDAEHDAEAAERAAGEREHGCNLRRSASACASGSGRGRSGVRYLSPCLIVSVCRSSCSSRSPAASRRAARRGATVLFASGADLQSMNPLVTLHPLARQVQRYVLLTTLARYDSALVPEPYLARAWDLVARTGGR